MKNFILICIALLIGSCTNPKVLKKEPPLKYSFLPSYLNPDSLRPYVLDDTNRVLDSTLTDFPSIALDGGKFIGPDKDTIKLPPGVLISDRKAILYPFYKSGWERQRIELDHTKYLMSEYYRCSKSAEVLYQTEIVKLEKKAERSWLEKNIGYIGFMSGITVSVLILVITNGIK